VFEAIIWQENLNVVFGNRGYIAENQKLNDKIRYFGKTGSFGFLFFIKKSSALHF
jgi:hypothetical protein